ncbi:MAG TPA: aconitate hydratase AcnA [Candidatus Krumholzibacteria bacterium]|nr:aconitate hydratase AcnA [Candidatus Krumholzibacteria bacterium]
MRFVPSKFRQSIRHSNGDVTIYSLPRLAKENGVDLARLPYSVRVLLESAIRNNDDFKVTDDDVDRLLHWSPQTAGDIEIAFKPARVILQDFTGVPAVVDLAAMRSAMHRMGKDYKRINPLVPCDLVVDHSVQVDAWASPDALRINSTLEFERNHERYEFLKWGQKAFQNFRVVPPATGIVHQVNLEYLARGVFVEDRTAYPDSLVGTDSHTTMINGLGIVGWGVGGIEAEAVMLGEPINMVMPHVVGFRFTGALREGITATDLVLTVTQVLRKKGVVGKFVEFFGKGLASMTLPDRATIANMAPEYGATIGFFPVDDETLRYYRLTGREAKHVDFIGEYHKALGMYFTPDAPEPVYSEIVELDLSSVEPSVAGPKRPQDRVAIRNLRQSFDEALAKSVKEGGFGVTAAERSRKVKVDVDGGAEMSHGSTVIAAITSCTNTSNPYVMVGAGLVARKAVERGLHVKPFVKTSLAPGSPVVSEYLEESGLQHYLDELGFEVVGYGCTTCIGNSGPLPDVIASAIEEGSLVAAAVLSGNRNFEGRVHPLTRANFLASPPLVVAYALAGTMDINLDSDPLGKDSKGAPVYLKDIWPSNAEVRDVVANVVKAKSFQDRYQDVFKGNEDWNAIEGGESDLYGWEVGSTYVREPSFFEGVEMEPAPIAPVRGLRVLAALGDSVTTDHISPAGSIAQKSPAARYLVERGVQPKDFNSYGSRRGNHEVMVRGTFANIRLRNKLVPGSEGTWTKNFLTGEEMTIYDASLQYQAAGVPLMVIAGKEYGSGSSRDWAAKGPALLGIRVVIAESYERIHRSNLVGMGILPLQFMDGENAESLGLKGDETFDVAGLSDDIKPGAVVTVTAKPASGAEKAFETRVRIDTPVEAHYYRNGGILRTVLRRLAE